MSRFFALISVVFALLLQADVAQASCANDGEQQGTSAVSASATSIASLIVHDKHIPCSDATHLHVSCVCAGQFFVPASVLLVPDFSYTIVRFELNRAMLIGRELQPPVPPPL